MFENTVEEMAKQSWLLQAKSDLRNSGEEIYTDGYVAGYNEAIKLKINTTRLTDYPQPQKEWHYCKDGDYPQLVDLPDGSNYNPLVLVFWRSFDSNGKESKVYALDRWCPELKIWDEHNRRGIIAWQPLPEPPEEIEK